MAALSLDERCAVIPGAHVLHVLHPGGAHVLRGRDIHRLHERLAPFLRGTHDERQLLAAVPPAAAGAVGAYLAGLRATGALRAGRRPSVEADEIPSFEPGVRRLSFRAGGVSVHASLDGWDDEAARAHRVHLAFVTPEEAGRLLARAGEGGVRGRIVLAVADADVSFERRAALARWLLAGEVCAAAGAGSRLRVFAVDGPEGPLARLLEVSGRDARRGWEIPSALHVVRFAEAEQLPLVVAEASHAFFSPSLRGVGVSYGRVRDPLLRRFVARLAEGDGAALVAPTRTVLQARALEWLALREDGIDGDGIGGFDPIHRLSGIHAIDGIARAAELPPTDRDRTDSIDGIGSLDRIASLDGISAICRISSPDCGESSEEIESADRIASIDRIVSADESSIEVGEIDVLDEIDHVRSEAICLLREGEAHPVTAPVAKALRGRMAALPAGVGLTADGVWVAERGGRRAASLVREMAIGELLVAEAWAAFHAARPGDAPPPVAWEHADFVAPAALRRRVAGVLKRRAARGAAPLPEGRRVRCWGVTAWVAPAPREEGR